MDKQRLYDIIKSIDDCLLKVEMANHTTELFNAAFELNDNADGDCATEVIIRLIKPIEQHLDKLHTEVDQYILDNLK